MRINTPINHPDEAKPMIQNGAHEFYCGYVPPEWSSRFTGMAQMNKRDIGPANISKKRLFTQIVETAHQYSKPVYLTLNAQTCNPEQMEVLRKHVANCISRFHIDGFIVADPAVALAILEMDSNIRVHLSSIASTHNLEAIKFFADTGIKRIILPRHISVEEAVRWRKECPSHIELEVFILNDGCIYEEGFCSTLHGIGPICFTEWDYNCKDIAGKKKINSRERAQILQNTKDYRSWTEAHLFSSVEISDTHVPLGPCGLCALPAFFGCGMDAIKIVGREAPSMKKLRSLQIVNAIVKDLENGKSDRYCKERAIKLRGAPALCETTYRCYYPSG